MDKTQNLFSLVIRRQESWDRVDTWVVPFLYDPQEVPDPEAAIRTAVQAFLLSPEGQSARDYACGEFNWGDVMSSVPDDWFIRYGMNPVKGDATDAEVNHDEILDPGNLDDEED